MANLVIFSGLPGTGKSTLADRLAREMGWPLFRIDDVAACLPASMDRDTFSFWDQVIASLLLLTEAQLKLGISVIADSVFMNLDRFHARAIARQTGASFLPVHTFISDESVWEQRVMERFTASDPADGVASWEQVQAQRRFYRLWEPGTALFVDAIQPPEKNYAAVLAFVTGPDPRLEPLPEISFTPGKYHG
jgi:predicted kinase